MNLKAFVQTYALFVVVAISAVRAQDKAPCSGQLPTRHLQQSDDPLQKIIEGEYAPEIYRANADDDGEKRLLKQQINCLYAECSFLQKRAEEGQEGIVFLLDARRRLGDAKLEFHVDLEEQRKVLEEQLENAKELEESCAARLAAGTSRPDDAAKAAYFRIKVELALLRLGKNRDKNSENE
jgi:hypothetical protein